MYKNVKKIGTFYVIDVGEFKVIVKEDDYLAFIKSTANARSRSTNNVVGDTLASTPDIQVVIDERGKPSVGFYSALVVKDDSQVLELANNPKLFDLFSDYVPLHAINKVNPLLSSRATLLKTRYKEYRSARRRAGIPLRVE